MTIPQPILQRLQAGAIVLPDQPVKVRIGQAVVQLRVINALELAQLQSAIESADDSDPEAVRTAMQTLIARLVISVDGIESIDGHAVAIDLAQEPRLLSLDFWSETLSDAATLATLNRGLLGKSAPPPASSPGRASSKAAAAANAAPASKTRKRRSG